MFELTPEEMNRHRTFGLYTEPIPILHVESIAQAATNKALKEVVEWGEHRCDTHQHRMPLNRFSCDECLQELKEKINGTG